MTDQFFELEKRKRLCERICRRLSEGEPLTWICRDLDVSRYTIRDWRKKYPEIGKMFDQARDDGYDAIAADCLRIADESEKDWHDSDRGRSVDPEVVQRSKLRVWTRLQLLAKWDPRRYGERRIHAGDPENPLEHRVNGMTDEELEKRIRELAIKTNPGSKHG